MSRLAAFEDAVPLVRSSGLWLGTERLADRLVVDRELSYDEVTAIPEIPALHFVARDKVEDLLRRGVGRDAR